MRNEHGLGKSLVNGQIKTLAPNRDTTMKLKVNSIVDERTATATSSIQHINDSGEIVTFCMIVKVDENGTPHAEMTTNREETNV